MLNNNTPKRKLKKSFFRSYYVIMITYPLKFGHLQYYIFTFGCWRSYEIVGNENLLPGLKFAGIPLISNVGAVFDISRSIGKIHVNLCEIQ